MDVPRAAAILYGDWGTSKAYVIGLAFAVGGYASFWLIVAMCVLTMLVGINYIIVCRLYPEGGGVYASVRHRSRGHLDRRRIFAHRGLPGDGGDQLAFGFPIPRRSASGEVCCFGDPRHRVAQLARSQTHRRSCFSHLGADCPCRHHARCLQRPTPRHGDWKCSAAGRRFLERLERFRSDRARAFGCGSDCERDRRHAARSGQHRGAPFRHQDFHARRCSG